VKTLSHFSAARAETSFFEAVRRCAPSDGEDAGDETVVRRNSVARDGGARVSDPCSSAPSPCPAARKLAPRFRKTSKLLRHADFQRVYKQGRRHFAAHMTVFYLRRADVAEEQDVARPPSAGNSPRVGFTVGRVLGGAVERNRIKRRLREAVRRNLASLPAAVDVVINPKKSALVAEFSVLNDQVARAFQVIGEKESRHA
jgi:ribonuclease P protein component